ncbi:uncharacterized protein LOC132753917 [Ruditapes philippinarum]|uniref:uncharacterized protein LOC132753917 n=1 Tax=Ruditapes philippinarum TaxID=129788 RepID=UPI00295AD5D5|nr:uncharacterized protein LOC132753917 [Ruditapes philippinarum]
MSRAGFYKDEPCEVKGCNFKQRTIRSYQRHYEERHRPTCSQFKCNLCVESSPQFLRRDSFVKHLRGVHFLSGSALSYHLSLNKPSKLFNPLYIPPGDVLPPSLGAGLQPFLYVNMKEDYSRTITALEDLDTSNLPMESVSVCNPTTSLNLTSDKLQESSGSASPTCTFDHVEPTYPVLSAPAMPDTLEGLYNFTSFCSDVIVEYSAALGKAMHKLESLSEVDKLKLKALDEKKNQSNK